MKCWICLTMERPWWISRSCIIKLSPDGELALGKESLCSVSVCWCPRTRPLQNCVKRDCWTQTEPEVVDQWHVCLGVIPGQSTTTAYFGKPDLGGVSNRERVTTHWEWRDGGSSVYPPGNVASEAGYCALGWRKPVPVLNELSEGWYMQA
jgi:hypothetical protein